jgi:hypothetical protein
MKKYRLKLLLEGLEKPTSYELQRRKEAEND